jgi:hypothetical protein
LPAFFGFFIFETQMGCAGRVVIDHPDTRFCERVQNGTVQFDQSSVFPKSGRTGSVEPESAGNFGKEVVSIFIGKVPGTDLRFHIPTTEGSGWEGDAADFKAHIGNDWEGYPAEMERVEAGGIGMTDGDLQSFFFWGRKKTRLFSWKRNHDRKEIKSRAFFWRPPAKVKTKVGEIGLGRIP